ncbi:hypothetical protein BJX64DRAFT_274188 [Aspergillus heterothallicus]
MSATPPSVSGVLLVGSVPLATTSETLKYHIGGIDLPAGHTGTFTLEDVKPTEYGNAAVHSYKKFLQHQENGVIPPGVRFQVSLPIPFAAVQGQIRSELRAQIEPLYEKRMSDAVRTILENIPAHDLAIQLDLALKIMALEYERGRVGDYWKPYFADEEGILEGILNRIQRFAELISNDVHLGFHFCYGNRDHKHFIEPETLGVAVEFANNIRDRLKWPIGWMHFPVPKDRDDAAYFEPLSRLELGLPVEEKTRLYLGLVHANDEEGTKRRLQMASFFAKDFGVATECGLGRTPVAELDSILSISRDVSRPIELATKQHP